MLQDGWGEGEVSTGQDGVWGLGTFVLWLGTEQNSQSHLAVMQG